MLYATLAFWLLLSLLTGLGLYRFWTRQMGGAVVDWLLLPATLVSELAYSLGRMLTGRPAYGGIISPQNVDNDACRVAISGKHGFWVSMLATFLTMVSCGLLLGLTIRWLGESFLSAFVLQYGLLEVTSLPMSLPTTWDAFWELLLDQIELLRRFCETLLRQDWLNWRAGLFVYLSGVFAVRLGPVRHDRRATLLVAAVLVALLAGAGAMVPAVDAFVRERVWHVLTYVWAMLLSLLVITLLLTGGVVLARQFSPSKAEKE